MSVGQNWGVPLTPVQWPQDTLQVPQGYGQMPAVDIVNAKQVRRELFVYPCAFLPFAPTVPQSQIIKLDKDGDFWCNSIIAYAVTVLGSTPTYPNSWQVTVTDLTTRYKLFNPSIPFGQLTRDSTAIGTGLTLLNTFDEPYCFLRTGGIEVTITNNGDFPYINANVYFAFAGWKEYANAAP